VLIESIDTIGYIGLNIVIFVVKGRGRDSYREKERGERRGKERREEEGV